MKKKTHSRISWLILLGGAHMSISAALAVPAVSFESAASTVTESIGSVSVAITMTPAPTGTVVVPFTPAAGANLVLTGTLADVTLPKPQSVTFKRGETRKVFTVKVVNDNLDEEDEQLTLNLTPGAAYTIGAQADYHLTITDNDTTPAITLTSGATRILFASNPATPLFLRATATGSPPLSYQWLLNGKPIAKANKDSYYLPTVTTANAGLYSCTVTNPVAKGVPSAGKVEIGVIAHGFQKLSTTGAANLVLSQTGSANVGFLWFKDGSDVEYAAPAGLAKYSTTKNSLTLLKATPFTQFGSFVCKPFLKSNTGIAAPGIQYLVEYVQKAAKLPPSLALRRATVGIPYTESVSTATESGGVVWSAKSLPKGLAIDPVSGEISGIPTAAGTAKVTIVASNSAGQPATLVTPLAVDPAPFVGTISGLMERDPSNNDLGGIVRIAISSTGAFTGKYTSGSTSIALFGQGLGPSGQPGGESRFYGPDGKFYKLTFSYNDVTPGAGQGTLVSADSPDLDINPFSLDFTLHGGLAGAMPAAGDYAGQYNFSAAFKTPLPGDQQPKGASIGSIKIINTGSATFTCRMADGTTFTSSNLLAYDHSVIVYGWLYNNRGSFMSQPVITLAGAHNEESTLSDLFASWSKLPETPPASRLYSQGWPGSEMLLTGQKWDQSFPPAMLLGSSETPGTPNALLAFTDGGLDVSAALPNVPITFPDGLPPLPSAENNPRATKFILNTITGTFTGTFVISTSQPGGPTLNRMASYWGQFQGNAGYGYFLLPTVPDISTIPPQTTNTAPLLSGGVSLTPL